MKKLLEKTFLLLFCLAAAPLFAAEPTDIKTLFDSIPEAESVRTYEKVTNGNVVSIAWSPDGKRFLFGGAKKRVTMLDAENNELLYSAPIAVLGNSVAFISPTEFFYTGQVICIADANGEMDNVQWRGPIVSYKGRASVRADGKVVSFADRKQLHIWDLVKRKHIRSFDIDDATAVRSDLEPSGKRVVVCKAKGAVLYDAENGERLHELSDAHGDNVTTCAFGPNDMVATGAGDGNMVAWDAKSGEMVHCVTNLGNHVTALAFSHDGSKLAVVVHNSDGYVFDTKTWEPICRLPSRSEWSKQIAWDPTDAKLAVAQMEDVKIYKIPAEKK